jgi:hypothetical protein
MGLHAGLYTHQLSNPGTRFVPTQDVSHRDDTSFFTKEFLKTLSKQAICPHCRQKLSPGGIQSEWLGEREEGP